MKHKSSITFARSKLKDFLILIGLFVLGSLLVLLLRPGYLVNILLVYFPGMIYCLSLLKHSRRKILIFGLLSLMFIIPVEVLARKTNSWDVLSAFPRLLNIAPLENIVYGFVNIVYPLAFYEYFFDQDRNRRISPRDKWLVLIYGVLFAGTFTLYFLAPQLLNLDYWMLGCIILTPVLLLLFIFKRHILKRLLVPALVFGTMFAIHEVISMILGHWWWPGTYLFPVTLLGHVYPLDDLIIWILFSNAAVIAGYEVLWD